MQRDDERRDDARGPGDPGVAGGDDGGAADVRGDPQEEGKGGPAKDAAPITGKLVAETMRGVGRGDLAVVGEILGVGSERARAAIHRLQAEHVHFAGVLVGTSDYLSIRDNGANDGTYRFADDVDVDAIDDEGLASIEQVSRKQLLYEAEALVHAARAYELEPKHNRACFVLERCIEGALDAAGTILAARAEVARRRGAETSDDAPNADITGEKVVE